MAEQAILLLWLGGFIVAWWWEAIALGSRSYLVVSGGYTNNDSVLYQVPPGAEVLMRFPLDDSYPLARPIVFVGNDTVMPPLVTRDDFVREFQNRTTLLLLHRRVFVGATSWLYRDGVRYFRCWCHWNPRGRQRRLRGRYSDVLAMVHTYPWNYAHWNFDIAPFLLSVPASIINRSFIVSQSSLKYARETLFWFGLRFRIIEMDECDYVFAERAYQFEPFPCDVQWPWFMRRWRSYVKVMAGLDDAPPSRFYIMNRPPGRRHIKNMAEVVELFRRGCPTIPWSPTGAFQTIIQSSRVFNAAAFLMAVHGAGCVNVIFMQPETIYVEIQPDWPGMAYVNLTRMFGQHLIVARIPELTKVLKIGGEFPLDKAEEVLNISRPLLARWAGNAPVASSRKFP